MKLRSYTPPRGTPYQQYLATQRRMKWAAIAGKVLVGLLLVGIALGKIGV
jgi:hypothetical protein